jgi:hypothetical protein
MPRKTIYIREADTSLWERAEDLADGSLSAFLTEKIREFVAQKEAEARKPSPLTVDHGRETKRVLYLWASQQDPAGAMWGTSFGADSMGQIHVATLMETLKRDAATQLIEIEERVVYTDGWVTNSPRERWVRGPDNTWQRDN